MKKLWWLLALFALATGVKEAFDHFGPMAQAFRAYRAEAEDRVAANDLRFASIEGDLIDVRYRLESADRDPDGTVRLVVMQALHFQKFSESGPFGNRRVAQTRQRVAMRSIDGRWVISDLREEATEVTELSTVIPGEE
jgi:hypothetical protein